jgi:hypothetical protein
MTVEPSKSVLSREQIRQALAVLREEQQAHPISAARRRLFVWYGISVWFFIISLFVSWIAFLWIKPELQELLQYFLVVVFVSFLAIVLLFFLNMKLILDTWREFRIALRTKLWQLETQMRTRRRWPRRLMKVVGAFFLVAFLAGTWGALIVAIVVFLQLIALAFLQRRWAAPIAAIVVCLLLIAVVAYFFLRFARKRLDVLRDSDRLVAFLTELDASEAPTGIGRVAIPTAYFKGIGAIEDIHIQRHRAKAIDEFRHSAHGYAVVKSRAIIADIAKLDEASQLRIEARIVELASESPPPEATLEPGGIWRVPVTETPYEIVCRQDQAAHRIKLLSLRQSDGTSSPRPIAEAPHG